MPYIEQARRPYIDKGGEQPRTKGELNYAITRLLVAYVKQKGKSYTNISEACAAARDAADEMRRRVLDPYEDAVCVKNGDVYDGLVEVESAPKPHTLGPVCHEPHLWRYSGPSAVDTQSGAMSCGRSGCTATRYFDRRTGKWVTQEGA